jgi:hypothetical protein
MNNDMNETSQENDNYEEARSKMLEELKSNIDFQRMVKVLEGNKKMTTSGGNKKYNTKAKAKRLRKLQKKARKVNR